ncbi:unnamed protein product, partial [Notodromas monacha]
MDSTAWDVTDLRKQANHLENELDLKLVAFSKLGAGLGTTIIDETSDTSPLISKDNKFDTLTSEIEQILAKLTAINDQMSSLPLTTTASIHTVQRHRDILQDYVQEFHRTKNNIQACRNREELLGGANQTSGLSRRMDFLLKESNHLQNSDRLIDEQINTALEVKEHLHSQRAAMKLIQTKMNDMANRFPMLNSLVQRINFRKRRDSIIIGSVIGICFFLLLLTGRMRLIFEYQSTGFSLAGNSDSDMKIFSFLTSNKSGTSADKTGPDRGLTNEQALSIACYIFVVGVIGIPLWWKTTEVYRVHVPHGDIKALQDFRFVNKIPIKIFLTGETPEFERLPAEISSLTN